MTNFEFDLDGLMRVCAETTPDGNISSLLGALAPFLGGLEMTPAAQRSGWYRLGGVVDPEGRRVTDDLAAWLEEQGRDGLGELFERVGGLGYLVTKRLGKTHYFTAPAGERPEDFVQLEVEEMREVVDRLLFDPQSPPEDLQDLLDPTDYQPLEPRPLGGPCYSVRRITPIAPLLQDLQEKGPGGALTLRRFLDDWQESSAREHRFCDHWILMLRRETGRYGEPLRSAKPSPASLQALPRLELSPGLRGLDLAKRVNSFDRAAGYSFAWYFLMLASRQVPHETAQRVLRDLMGAYDYLPARDLKVLRRWSDAPYAV